MTSQPSWPRSHSSRDSDGLPPLDSTQHWRSGSGGRCAYQRPGLHETRPRARAREFSSDSLSAGARLAGRSHGLTPGWFCWTRILSECTSRIRITRREGFTLFDRVGLRAAGSGESPSAAVQLDRLPAMPLLRLSCIHCDSDSGLFLHLSLHRQFVQEHALTQITRVETSGSRVVAPETEPSRHSPPPAFLEPPAASLRTPLSPNRAIPSSSRALKSIELAIPL